MEYLKLFGTQNEYEAYVDGGGLVLPNVSLIEESMSMGYQPWVETRLIAKYNVTSASSPTTLRANKSNVFKSMEIDGVMLDELVTEYIFDTIGEHTVKYDLYDKTKLGDAGFWNCSSLTSLTIPASVTSIGGAAFKDCSGLTSITIPDSITNIGYEAFRGCSKLTSITIPDSVTSIGGQAFSNCSGLTNINVNSGNNVYDSRNNCNAIIETATNKLVLGCKTTIIPDSVTSVGGSAFIGCSGLTSITIPDSIISINRAAFEDCSGLTSITIPDSVTSIGNRAFFGCSGLTSITIGNSVTSIDSQAFDNCSGLTSIVSNAMTAPTILSTTFGGLKTGSKLIVPRGSTGYNAWMSKDSYYLGYYNWKKVEQ